MYDSFNELNSNTFEDISYWDIGFIRVWDNVNKRFGDGYISKLFTSLPEKVSVGNATFSKNSANIIAFDYMYEATNEYAVLGANLETGDLEIIYQNTVLGHPTFSADDRKMAFSGKSTLNMDVIGIIPLAANKIAPAGNATILVNDATYPVFFSTGTRNLGLSPVANFSADLKAGKAPLKVRFLDLSVNNPTAWKWTFPGGTPNSSNSQNPEVTYNANGVYEVTLTASNAYGNNVITKTGFITVSPSTASGDLPAETVTFYPNPVRDFLVISAHGDFKICLYNAGGTKILEEINARQTDLSRLSPGIYLLEITADDHVLRSKIIKQ
jgi:PKD repeat protein